MKAKNRQLENRRAVERAKYEKLLARLPVYFKTNNGAPAILDVLGFVDGDDLVVDVGCGDNSFARALKRCDVRALGVDLVHPDADHVSPAHSLPFGDKSVAVLTSFDMLEHLLEAEVDTVLDEFRRVARRYVFSICYRESETKVDGEGVHPTVRPASWWRERIERVATYEPVLDGAFISGQFYDE